MDPDGFAVRLNTALLSSCDRCIWSELRRPQSWKGSRIVEFVIWWMAIDADLNGVRRVSMYDYFLWGVITHYSFHIILFSFIVAYHIHTHEPYYLSLNNEYSIPIVTSTAKGTGWTNFIQGRDEQGYVQGLFTCMQIAALVPCGDADCEQGTGGREIMTRGLLWRDNYLDCTEWISVWPMRLRK